MRLNQTRAAPPAAPPRKPSLLGMLFRPRFGNSLSLMRENNRTFLQLLAGVFAIYGMFPKDHPAFTEDTAKLSLQEIIATAWQHVSFTRVGLPKTIMFFAVTGIMLFSAIVAIVALLGLLSAHAHADTLPGASAFQPESNDLAQSWINYLFLNPSGNISFPQFNDAFGDGNATMNDPFAGSISLQGAMISALAFYSEAILVVAAFILFYHLTAMVVDTAHSGKVMGEKANQVWAPIRLVVAIGLLVPINGGLNCGQFIVIKVAELGSGLASQTWDLFLNQLMNYNSQGIPPNAPAVETIALDLIKMQACQISWNQHIAESMNDATQSLSVTEMSGPTSSPYTAGNIPGTKYSYSGNTLEDQDVCGWYFIPNNSSNGLASKAATYQQNAISASADAFQKATSKMNDILCAELPQGSTPPGGCNTTPTLDNSFINAVAQYQQNLSSQVRQMNSSQGNLMQAALEKLKPYGWVMAGATLNTIDRMQGSMIAAASDSIPVTHQPTIKQVAENSKPSGIFAAISRVFGGGSNADWDLHNQVAKDMESFGLYVDKSLQTGSSSSDSSGNNAAQCAAMVGLAASSANGGLGVMNSGVEWILGLVDHIAAINGVWNAQSGVPCAGSTTPDGKSSGISTFTLGIQFSGTDPFAQMAFLGHSNLNVAMTLLGLSFGSALTGGFASALAPIPVLGGIASGFGSLLSGAGSMMGFLALIFFVCGFTLAYMVPLLPFLRFFFNVISWVGGLIEAVIAVPLIALAHLNPEGAGLPGKAQGAYTMVFSLFLRPVLMIFGFICGYIVFLIALSFLNYAYGIAVAGAGGTAYGHAALSRIVFSILYVGIVYVCANHSFQLIEHLPENAMKWMGAEGMRFPNMGDAGKIETIATAISQYGGGQLMQQVSGAGSAIGGAPSGAIKQGVEQRAAEEAERKKAAKKAAKKAKRAMIGHS